MKKNVVRLPFCSTPSILWQEYFNYLVDYFRKKISSSICEVCYKVLSLKGDGSINTSENDFIILNDNLPEKISKRIFINFNISDDHSKISFDFLKGSFYEGNFKYKKISEIYFDPKILGEDDLIKQLESFLRKGTLLNPNYFLKNQLASK